MQFGAYLDNFYNVINVKSKGAVFRAGVDNTGAVQRALTQAGSGGTVFIPYDPSGCQMGSVIIPPGVKLLVDQNMNLIAPSTLATSWVKAEPAKVHRNTTVIGGNWDASATTNVNVTAIIDISTGITSCPGARVQDVRTIAAPEHGILMSENTKTRDMKYITHCTVDGHGTIANVGFGIYADYIGNILIDGNYVYTTTENDSIELGHSGVHWLGIDAHMRCVNNTVYGGQINYPFSDSAQIVNNTVIGNGIQNDGNTANYVQIFQNRVLGATPAASYGGISVWGTDPMISKNYIEVTSGKGIGGSWTHATVGLNIIKSTSGNTDGYGIHPGGGGALNTIVGNDINGFLYGMYMPFAQSSVMCNAVTCFNGVSFNGVSNSMIMGNMYNVTNQVYVGTPSVGCRINDNIGGNSYGSFPLAAATTSYESMNIPSGTAPTVPKDGDIWYDGANLKMHVGGVTKTFTLV